MPTLPRWLSALGVCRSRRHSKYLLGYCRVTAIYFALENMYKADVLALGDMHSCFQAEHIFTSSSGRLNT